MRKLGLALIAVLLIVAVTAVACGTESTPAGEGDAEEQVSESEATATTAPTETPSGPVPTATPKLYSETAGEVGSLAPDLSGISGWINTDEFTLASLRGEVVLIDFWTYTCVNCLRTLPYLRDWHEKYDDLGLNIVGVHTPEFEFEKDYDNVVAAVQQHDLGWRMAQDNDFRTWRSYNNRYWPAKYLIDHDGVIRYRHFGEGRYDETEEWIRMLLEEIGAEVSDVEVNADTGPKLDEGAFDDEGRVLQTRELYAGWHRNSGAGVPYIGNNAYYFTPVNGTEDYSDPGQHQNHYLYLKGQAEGDGEHRARQGNGKPGRLHSAEVLRNVSERGDRLSRCRPL
jgi:thiol-disulfide isomerase/thioredoxin